MKVKESLNVTFDESTPPTKLSPLVDDDVGEEEAIRNNTKVVNNINEEDESIEVDEVVNIKESKNHPSDQVIENLNQRTLRNKAMLVAQGNNQQEGIDYDETYTPVARLESIRILLVIACANDFKLYQMDVKSAFLNSFINEDYHLKAVKRIFRYVRGTTHLGLWYPKGTGIETIVYANSDHAGNYVDRKSISGVCTFMRCCLTSWFAKKQMDLAISTTEAEYVSVGKACQQALWMKQALIDYDIRLDDVLIMMSTEIKLTKEDEADSVDSSIYRENPKTTHLEAVKRIFRYIRGTSHLGLWYPKGCCLTSCFVKKQTALAISMTEAEYISAEKACQQALWMKQALIDYGKRLDDVPIMRKHRNAMERIFKKKAKNDQTKHGMEKTKSIRSQSQSKSKVSNMKKIQLEGLKLPNLKLCYKKTRAEIGDCGRSITLGASSAKPLKVVS
ncbi:copia protein [Tanacetum coccineum]